MKRLYIPLPEAPARKQIIINLLAQQSYNLNDEELDKICKLSDGNYLLILRAEILCYAVSAVDGGLKYIY